MAELRGTNRAMRTPLHANGDYYGAALRNSLRNLDPGAERGPANYFEPLGHA
jgi:hypothetical protein